MKSKVIILSAFLSPFRSGAESCAEEVALRLCDVFDITIVTARLSRKLPTRDVLQGKVPVVRVGPGLGLDKWLFPFLAPLATRKIASNNSVMVSSSNHDTVLIHAVLETFAGLALHFCRFTVPKAKRLLTLQTTNRSFLKKMIVRSPDHVTAISSVLAKTALGFGRGDITVIPNGLNIATIPQITKIPGRILFVGRLEKWKGVDVLLKAFARVVGAMHALPLQLRIVGDGSERQSLEQLANDLSITDRVTFVGFVPIPEVYDEFAQAEIFCGLSRSEALGNVFLEAQAAGCAVIGTNVGGIPDVVEQEKTGLLIEPDNVEAARSALVRLLSDANLRDALAGEGRKRAKMYDWRRIAERYQKVYSDTIKSFDKSCDEGYGGIDETPFDKLRTARPPYRH